MTLAFIVAIVKAVALPVALVILVCVPWKAFSRWQDIHFKQMEAYLEMTRALLATKATLEQGHPAGPALLQGITKRPPAPTKIEMPKKPPGMRIIQGVPSGNLK